MNTYNSEFHNLTFEYIYNHVYKHMSQDIVDIFLCGGASSSKYKSIRDQLRTLLEMDNKIRVLYPEDLFLEMLNLDKSHDLLSLEGVLADNCDFICIVCESAGSLVELGAFTNNSKTVNKVFALIDKTKMKQKSFIMLGPVKHLERQAKGRVLFYDKESISEINLSLLKNVKKAKRVQIKKQNHSNFKPINTIVGLHHFISMLLFFFSDIEKNTLVEALRYVFRKDGHETKEFNNIFTPTLKLLYKEKYILSYRKNGKFYYKLTSSGQAMVDNILREADIKNKNLLYDKIRFSIINDKYYRSS